MIRSASEFFLSQRIGRWRWPWLVLGIVAGVAGIIVALLVAFAAVAVARALGSDWAAEAAGFFELEDVNAASDVNAVSTVPSFLGFELVLTGASFWAAAIVGSLVQGRPVRSLVAPIRSFDWSIARKVLTVQAVLFSLVSAPMFFLPWLDRPDFTGLGVEHLIWLVPIAAMVLFQTSGEDVFFKGYLLRQVGAVTKVVWFAPVVVVLVFVSLHIGNADVQSNLWLILPAFAISEVMAIYLTMRTAGMEVAIAWHWFNNASIFLLVAERATQANELTVFVFDEDSGSITDDVIAIGFYAVFLVVQLLAFTMRRSPFFLEPHDWGQSPDNNTDWDLSAPPPTSPPMVLSEIQ